MKYDIPILKPDFLFVWSIDVVSRGHKTHEIELQYVHCTCFFIWCHFAFLKSKSFQMKLYIVPFYWLHKNCMMSFCLLLSMRTCTETEWCTCWVMEAARAFFFCTLLLGKLWVLWIPAKADLLRPLFLEMWLLVNVAWCAEVNGGCCCCTTLLPVLGDLSSCDLERDLEALTVCW